MADEAFSITFNNIPPQLINEGASYGPFALYDFIQWPEGMEPIPLRFEAEIADSGQSLTKGLICTEDGLLSGIPARGTQGTYEILLTAISGTGEKWTTTFKLTIKPSLTASVTSDEYVQLKSKVWEALDQGLPMPDLEALYSLPITIAEIYYLLERWATLKIWDAYNLEPAGEKHLLQLEGASPHYNVYDRGSCLVASPKDLFSHERTSEDALMTARAMAREVYKRGWAIEFAGFDKMVRAAWIEVQHQGDKHGRPLEIVNFTPTEDDMKLYMKQAEVRSTVRREMD